MPKTKAPPKLTISIPGDLREELERESERLDRSISWLLARTWKLAKGQIALMPDDPSVHRAAGGVQKGDGTAVRAVAVASDTDGVRPAEGVGDAEEGSLAQVPLLSPGAPV